MKKIFRILLLPIGKLLHDILGWGFPVKGIGGDHFQPTHSCKFCKYEITKDSQGNWFHLN